jgi:hypothetical protein
MPTYACGQLEDSHETSSVSRSVSWTYLASSKAKLLHNALLNEYVQQTAAFCRRI